MPRRNRVDPFGELHAVPERGMFTGNRGCLVDDRERVVRHHRGRLWITCVTEFRGRRVGLARPGRWTPVFFLDDAVALAAGHRPCGECRYATYRRYRDAVSEARGEQVRAGDLNRLLATERGRRWTARSVPDGAVVLHDGPRLVLGGRLLAFSFGGWSDTVPRPAGELTVLTPQTSVQALSHGFTPVLHETASIPDRPDGDRCSGT
ncbi:MULTISPECIES: hypothetical protein [unclassified Pseudonocardia]|uniref:hypothetical protein n=1 Tax=unclassified Pseudonocardia TaxID=2619320 RepID=UPI00095E8B22|nr:MULTISPECIES: hypothetical protein [unclassified Pseudonocardia]MBN9098904.1 hypothetical protein [Pseudonocardia sp.]OJY40673.1 MAG: hypothetical protein BGP03_26395 [Pseudonocardia sp. 73-21]